MILYKDGQRTQKQFQQIYKFFYSSGMLRDKTMDDKSIYIPNQDDITIHSQDLLKSLNTTCLEPINNNSIPKFFQPKNKLYKTNVFLIPISSTYLHSISAWIHTFVIYQCQPVVWVCEAIFHCIVRSLYMMVYVACRSKF